MPRDPLTLSIVIGTKDRPQSLARCLQSIVAQTEHPDEVLIVDDGQLDKDRTVQPLSQAGITARYFNKSHDRGLTKSRNLGIRQSGGEVVLFLDDDVVLDPRYLAAIKDVYRSRPDAGGVGGRLANASLPKLKQLFLRFFLLDSARDGAVLPNGIGVLVRDIRTVTPVEWFSGCNMSFRRGVFSEFMFDEAFRGNGWGDDRDFSYAVSRKYPLLATPQAVLDHMEDPAGRAGNFEFGVTEITYVHRFFAKHMPRRAANRLALAWAFVGITLQNCVMRRGHRVRGNLAGILKTLTSRERPRTPRGLALGVLSEQGGSLRNLRRSGQDRRFVEQYLERYGRSFNRVYYFSYARETAALPDGCELVPNDHGLHRWVYAVLMPLLHARQFRECAAIRVMQLTGELPALVAKFLYGIPFAATYGYRYADHARADGAGSLRARLFALRTRIVLALADKIIITNPLIEDEVRSRVPPDRIVLLPNGVETSRFTPAAGRPGGDPPLLLYVGRLSRQKNLTLLIDAVALLEREVRLRFIGDGPLRADLAAHARAAGVPLDLAGVVDHDSLPVELQRAALFVLTSRIEGHPKALLEAMSCGCVCVATDAPGVSDLLDHEVTGLLCPPSAAALATTIERALSDATLRDTLSANARRRVERDFDIDEILRREVAMLHELGATTELSAVRC